jgi:tetratricopeptide (TPR) repeat protein
MMVMDLQARVISLLAVASLLVVSACSQGKVKQDTTDQQKHIAVDDTIKLMFTQALTHLEQEQYDEGIGMLETLTAKEKRLAAPYVNLGIAYSRKGESRQAEHSFSKALRIDAGHAVANNELGLLYRKSGRFNAARAAYQNALVQHPDYLPARKNLGILCELYLHDMACALKHYQTYLEYAPEEETIARWALELEQRSR